VAIEWIVSRVLGLFRMLDVVFRTVGHGNGPRKPRADGYHPFFSRAVRKKKR
jgi:hypothetical protein